MTAFVGPGEDWPDQLGTEGYLRRAVESERERIAIPTDDVRWLLAAYDHAQRCLDAARATNQRLNRRAQLAEQALGDLTAHPSVNQCRTGRLSYAVLAVAVQQANEQRDAALAEAERLRASVAARSQFSDVILAEAKRDADRADQQSRRADDAIAVANAAIAHGEADLRRVEEAEADAEALRLAARGLLEVLRVRQPCRFGCGECDAAMTLAALVAPAPQR